MTIDRPELISQISSWVDATTDPDDLQFYNPDSAAYQIRQRHAYPGGGPSGELESFGHAVAAYFGFDSDGMISKRKSPNGSGSGNAAWIIGIELINYARIHGIESALADFESLVNENSAHFNEVFAFWGINPENSFEIRDGITLAPLSSAPKSELGDGLLGIPRYKDAKRDSMGLQVHARPQAALMHSFKFGPVVSSESLYAASPNPLRSEEMRDIVLCLTLLSPYPVDLIAEWHYPDFDTPMLGGLSGGGGHAVMSGHGAALPSMHLDEAKARRMVTDFFNFEEKQKPRIRTVLRRLNLAKTRYRSWEDRAIDLGITIEAVFSNPKQKSSELSTKLKLRGAFLASTDPAERKIAAKLLDQIYDMRSRAAHGDEFEADDPWVELNDKIVEGTQLAVRLIERILALGRFPDEDWNGLILGWVPTPSFE